MLEVGCGSGRFTEIMLASGADVFTLDYSRAVDPTFAKFGDRAHVSQASIYDLPYEKGSLDRVFCFGVLQHCPDVRAAFTKLVEMLKPGGHLAVDVHAGNGVEVRARRSS